uniref:Hairless n=1 Tax=Anopheles minimus TaxID=112268 RepID=A0A182W333_9DIPT
MEKDGKFILELARAREGEKTSWISVPRKTYWPPTVSSTSANFHKHEISDDNSSIQSSPWQRDHCWKQSNPRSNISKELSLYYFRPLKARGRPSHDTRLRWRRKRRRPYESSLPPEAISKVQSNLTVGSDVAENGKSESKNETKPTTDEIGKVPECHSEMSNGTTPMDTTEEAQATKEDDLNGAPKVRGSNQNGPMDDDHEQSNGHHLPPNGTHFRTSRWIRSGGKVLDSIIKTLVEQQQTKVANSRTSPAGGSSAISTFRLGTIAERGNGSGTGFRSSVFASSAATQHVSPRKRILRELEKVSLDDVGSGGTSSSTKRSRPKSGSAVGTPVIVTATTATPLSTLTTNGTGSPLNGGSAVSHSSSGGSNSKTNGHLNGSGSIVNGTAGTSGKQSLNGSAGSGLSPASKNAPTAPAPVSKPFSSYSITSLLGHSTSSNSGESSSSSANSSSSDALQRKTDVSVASVTSTASHHHYHPSQHSLSPHHQYQGLPMGSKSPVMTETAHHAHYQGQLGSNRYGGYNTKKRSPSYGGGNGTVASPGATSGGSGSVDPYGNTIRSPDLSPSPEHHHTHQQHSQHSTHQTHHALHHTPGSVSNSGYSRYRQHPYGGSPSSYSSAPSSSRFSPSPSTNDSATTPPYSGSVSGAVPVGARSAISYRAGGYQLGGNSSQGHSPPASNGSPQHYSRASPLNFGRGVHHSPPPPVGSHQHQHNRNAGTSSSSPRASPNGGGVTTNHATTPTSAMASLTTGASPSTTIRTVPKKTAALRQPFSGGHSPSSSSPSRERSNSNTSSSSVKKESLHEGSDLVDGPPSLSHQYGTTPSSPAGVIRPNTVIASPAAHHPVANPYYPLYQSSSSPSMNATAVAAAAAAASAVSFHPASLSYYQQMYTAATMAFRSPLWMHYQGLPGIAPHAPHMVQSPHHHLPSTLGAPAMPLADRRIIDRNPPSPPPPASVSSIIEPTESQRLQHSILATPSTTAAAALNYSVTALTSSSRDIVNGGSAFSSPSGSNWPTDHPVGYQPHPDLSSRSSVVTSGITSASAKDEPSNGECLQGLRSSYVPLNLSKH